MAASIQSFEESVEVLLAPQTNSNRHIHLGVQHVLRSKPFHQPVSDEFVVVGSLQVFGHSLEGHQETVEILVAVELLDLARVLVLP